MSRRHATYFSTSCLHGKHGHCRAYTGRLGPKTPGECKWCPQQCVCPCHQQPADPQAGPPLKGPLEMAQRAVQALRKEHARRTGNEGIRTPREARDAQRAAHAARMTDRAVRAEEAAYRYAERADVAELALAIARDRIAELEGLL